MSFDLNKDLYLAFFNNAEIHFMLFDKDLNVLDVNEVLLNDYHLKKEEIVGKNILEISPDAKEKGLYDKYHKVIETGESIIIEELVSHQKFGNRYNKIKAFKVGEGLGATASNITEYKNTIQALEMFTYKSSHDMRSPINNIIGITEIASNTEPDINSIKEYCSVVQHQAKKLKEFLDRLLDTIKYQHHALKIEKIDFELILSETLKSLSFTNGFNEVRVEKEVKVFKDFYFDVSVIQSIFQNLIENSIKYRKKSEEPSFVKVLITRNSDVVKIIVEDNGIGISEKAQKDIFKMFYRATDYANGSGLGLYNLRYTIEKLGGFIKFESEEHKGTRFIVFLPDKSKQIE